MTKITPKNVKAFSLAFHGVLSGFLVLGLLIATSPRYSNDLILLWSFSVISACSFGWFFGSWYVPEKGGLIIEPYIVTPIISLLSAIAAALLFSFVKELLSGTQNIFNLVSVLRTGLLLGVYAFFLILPITVIIGVGMASYLYNFGGYKNAL